MLQTTAPNPVSFLHLLIFNVCEVMSVQYFSQVFLGHKIDHFTGSNDVTMTLFVSGKRSRCAVTRRIGGSEGGEQWGGGGGAREVCHPHPSRSNYVLHLHAVFHKNYAK